MKILAGLTCPNPWPPGAKTPASRPSVGTAAAAAAEVCGDAEVPGDEGTLGTEETDATGEASAFGAVVVPFGGLTGLGAGGLAEHHVFGEVLVKRSKPVTDPRAYGRMGAFAHMPPCLKRQLGAVIVIERPE